MKNPSSKYILIYAIVFFGLLAGCTSQVSNPVVTVPSTRTAVQTAPNAVSPTNAILRPSASPVSPTPTARVLKDVDNCASALDSGHILFLRSGSPDDLYVMDGHGCSRSLLIADVSGAPAWSTDGKQISVGCEGGRSLCILDAQASLHGCLRPGDLQGTCTPVILQKYALPSGSGRYVYNTSWTYDNKQIVVESRNSPDNGATNYYVDILTLAGNGQWRLIIQGINAFDVEASPVANEILFDGNYIMPLDGGPISRYSSPGYRAIWSHDGAKIAFLEAGPTREGMEPLGIAEWDFRKTPHWNWLYEPQPMDYYSISGVNYIIDNYDGDYRTLSWSWDGKYIAFEGGTNYEVKDLFRLDVATGEVDGLTTRYANNKYPPTLGGYAPAWGP